MSHALAWRHHINFKTRAPRGRLFLPCIKPNERSPGIFYNILIYPKGVLNLSCAFITEIKKCASVCLAWLLQSNRRRYLGHQQKKKKKKRAAKAPTAEWPRRPLLRSPCQTLLTWWHCPWTTTPKPIEVPLCNSSRVASVPPSHLSLPPSIGLLLNNEEK